MGQVAKGTTAGGELGPHGSSVRVGVEEALPGVELVGGVFGLVGSVWVLIGGGVVPVCGVFACVGAAWVFVGD